MPDLWRQWHRHVHAVHGGTQTRLHYMQHTIQPARNNHVPALQRAGKDNGVKPEIEISETPKGINMKTFKVRWLSQVKTAGDSVPALINTAILIARRDASVLKKAAIGSLLAAMPLMVGCVTFGDSQEDTAQMWGQIGESQQQIFDSGQKSLEKMQQNLEQMRDNMRSRRW
jgi:hypothetical protein